VRPLDYNRHPGIVHPQSILAGDPLPGVISATIQTRSPML